MYGLSSTFDTSCFIGLTLEQVSFTENTIHFSFSGKVSITLESSFEHHTKAGKSVQGNVPLLESQLMELVGESIESVNASSNGTLTLRFADGQMLVCLDDSSEYESYQLNFDDEEVVV